jgi:hypothetical protein
VSAPGSGGRTSACRRRSPPATPWPCSGVGMAAHGCGPSTSRPCPPGCGRYWPGSPCVRSGGNRATPVPLTSSPDAPEARDGNTRETAWTGDQVPRTDPCADETPPRITAVRTTPATTAAVAVLPSMQAALATRQGTPWEPFVEAGAGRADHFLTRRPAPGIDLRGPVPGDQSGPGQAQHGCAAAHVVSDWAAKHAICLPGQRRVVGRARPARPGQATVRLACSQPGGAACASRAACTRAVRAPRARRLRAHDQDPVRQDRRARPQRETCKAVSARRAGLDGTMAQGTRLGARRRSRAIGWVHTRLRPLRMATALHCRRVADWRAASPRAQTRPSAFAARAAAG